MFCGKESIQFEIDLNLKSSNCFVLTKSISLEKNWSRFESGLKFGIVDLVGRRRL